MKTKRLCLLRVATIMLAGLLLAACAAPRAVDNPPVEGPVGLGGIAAVDGPRVRPDRVVEDSRCPADVQCIHAGRLIVRATVLGGGWSKQIDLTLGVPVSVADGTLTLAEATPSPIVGTEAVAAARFTFEFKGGR